MRDDDDRVGRMRRLLVLWTGLLVLSVLLALATYFEVLAAYERWHLFQNPRTLVRLFLSLGAGLFATALTVTGAWWLSRVWFTLSRRSSPSS